MAARFDAPELDGTLLTARAMEDAETLARACRVLGMELGGWELIRDPAVGRESEGQGLAVVDDGNGSNGGSTHGGEFETGYNPGNGRRHRCGFGPVGGNADVARIVPRVVSHRVRMRDGWTDEVLAGGVWGATIKAVWNGNQVRMEWRPRLGMEKRRLRMNSSKGVTSPLRSPTFTNYLHLFRRPKQKSPLLSFRELVPFYHLHPPRT